ncbi:MAG: hypothetical protein A2138_06060 [Deltaproteobacteria bacterium RBG_16_71_12]|nr:MAG: hypothetical protein A2138_06060 [Deltaproteobacteria bacterium RBG_16_71_12]
MVNFHLPLPEALSRELRRVAALEGRPATEIARELLRAALEERRRAGQRLAIKEWATQNAGGALDLDVDLEAAGAEVLRPRRQGPSARRRAKRT